jgi:hypothetical protein
MEEEHYDTLKREILRIRENADKKNRLAQFQIEAAVADLIRSDLLERGALYNDTQSAYYFLAEEKNLIEINQDDDPFKIMMGHYGLNPSEHIFSYVFEDLKREAMENGLVTEVHRLAYYHQDVHSLYLSNQDSQMYRITPDAIELVDNGTDGVLFLSEYASQPFEVTLEPIATSPLDDHIFHEINFEEDALSPDERRLLFALWFYSIFFESIMPTKPIVALIGEKGSGKTTTLRKVGALLLGDTFDVASLTEDPKDFDAAVTNAPFVVIDNADSKASWLNDKLAVAATGGKVRKRELYTTNKLVDFPIKSFIAITARTPQFRREDVAERLLIMRVGRLKAFKSEKHMLREVVKNREKIMSEVVGHLQEVVRALAAAGEEAEVVAFRMADFADFSIKVARYAGVNGKVKSIFEKLTLEQALFTLEGEPIIDLLSLWLKKAENRGREVTAQELCNELGGLAFKNGIEFPYEKKVQSFAQRLVNLTDDLSRFFTVSRRRGKARKAFYRFSLKEEKGAGSPASHGSPVASPAKTPVGRGSGGQGRSG